MVSESLPIIFNDHTLVRIVRLNNAKRTPVIPVVDIARELGIDRRYFHNLINRNKDIFNGLYVIVMMTYRYEKRLKNGLVKTISRKRNLICLTKEGIIGCLIKITTDRIKDPILRAKIIRFQRRAIKILSAITEGRLPEDFRLEFNEILTLPEGYMRGDAVRQYRQEKGVSRDTAYRHLRVARIQVGLPPSTRKTRADKGKTKYAAEKMQVLAYKKVHPGAGYKIICGALGLSYIRDRVKYWLKEM